VAISSNYNDPNGMNNAGHVRVFDWGGTNWIQRGQDIDGEAANDQSGWSVSISDDGNSVAIGAVYNDPNGMADAGHVRVYDWYASQWTQRGQDIDGVAADDRNAVVSLSDDGDTLAIGAVLNDSNGKSNAGHVRIFDWDGSQWTQRGQDIVGESAGDLSGFSVSISGDGSKVAIGAPVNRGAYGWNEPGQVRVYDWV
jgi:hypothetical protein